MREIYNLKGVWGRATWRAQDERRVVRARSRGLHTGRAPLRAVVLRETSPHPPMLRSSAGHVNRSQARPQNQDLLPPSARAPVVSEECSRGTVLRMRRWVPSELCVLEYTTGLCWRGEVRAGGAMRSAVLYTAYRPRAEILRAAGKCGRCAPLCWRACCRSRMGCVRCWRGRSYGPRSPCGLRLA